MSSDFFAEKKVFSLLGKFDGPQQPIVANKGLSLRLSLLQLTPSVAVLCVIRMS